MSFASCISATIARSSATSRKLIRLAASRPARPNRWARTSYISAACATLISLTNTPRFVTTLTRLLFSRLRHASRIGPRLILSIWASALSLIRSPACNSPLMIIRSSSSATREQRVSARRPLRCASKSLFFISRISFSSTERTLLSVNNQQKPQGLSFEGNLGFRTLLRPQCRRGNGWPSQVRRLLKTESELYQLGLRPSAAEKLHPDRNSDGSISRRRRKAGGNFNGRETRQSSNNAGAVLLKRCANGKDQTFLMGIHQRVEMIFRQEVGHFNPDFIHSHPAVFVVRGIGAILITLSRGEKFFQCRLVVFAGSNDFRERMYGYMRTLLL